MQNGKYCIIPYMTAIVYIGYAHRDVRGIIEISRKLNFDSWHEYVYGKIREGKSVTVILE